MALAPAHHSVGSLILVMTPMFSTHSNSSLTLGISRSATRLGVASGNGVLLSLSVGLKYVANYAHNSLHYSIQNFLICLHYAPKLFSRSLSKNDPPFN